MLGKFDIDEIRWQLFWKAVQSGEIVVILSNVLDDELENTQEQVRNFFDSLPELLTQRIESTTKSDNLAERYIRLVS